MTTSVTPRRPNWIVLVLLVFASISEVSAQCDPPDLLPDPDCNAAPLICLTDACYSTQSQPPPDPVNGFCGPMTALHNPQYILFQVTSLPVNIQIHVDQCNGGGCGLQSAIVNVPTGQPCESWTPDDVVVCDPGTNVGGTMDLTTGDLEIDSFYLLVIDGCAGQLCQWTIDIASGVYEPGLPTDEQLTFAMGDSPACPGQNSWTAEVGPVIPGVAGYLWYGFPWGDMTSTNPTLDVPIPDDAIPGDYEVCVLAFTGCDTTDEFVCFEFTIEPIPSGMSPDVTLCPEEFDAGVQWGSISVTSPGEYMQTFEDALGCISDSTKEFFSFPEPDLGMLDTLLCHEPPFFYEGTNYDAAGTYDLTYPNGSIYGCDSMAQLTVEFAYIEGDIVLECDNGDWILSVELFNGFPQNLDPQYYWTDNSGAFLSDEDEIIVTVPGTYNVDLIMEINGMQCVFPATPFTLNEQDILPGLANFTLAPTPVCATSVSQYCVENIGPEIIDYVWELPTCGTILTGEGTACVEIDWQGCSTGQVCVNLVNHCGEGEQLCFDVDVISEALPFFDAPATACVNEQFIVEFSGTASDNAQFFWNFGTATIVSGGTGEGPHELYYTSTGTKVIELKIYEPGCDTVYATQEVIVESLGVPVVNCESTTSSITFTWSQVPGASGYDVNVVSGPAGGTMPNDTTFSLTGLANGETVTIEVVVLGNGVCPDQIVEETCSAQDCTAPPHTVSGLTPQCENDANQILELTVNGAPATGVWSGPGVVDQNTGEFSPSTAGAGTHQISVMYDDGNCQFNWPVSIQVFAQPTATFTIDPVICESEMATVTYTGSADPGAMYTWSWAGGTVVSGTGAGPYQIRWNQDGAYTVSLTVEENGCTSTEVTRNIQVDPLVGVPSIQCATTTSSITFTWADVANASSYTVNVLAGETGTRNGNEYSITGLMPGDSTTLQVIAMGSGDCPPTADTITCYAQDCPTPAIALVPSDTSLCHYPGTGVFQMQANITGGGGTGTWSGPGITDPVTGRFDAGVAGSGTHLITYTYIDQGCMFEREAMIEVNTPPDAVIASADYTLTCDNGNRLTLDGTMSTATNGTPLYLWSSPSGVIVSRADSAHVVVGAPGMYQLLITDPVSGCVDSTSVQVMQDAGVPVANAGPDQVLNCEILSVSLGGMSSTGPDIHYLWSSVEGNIVSDPTQATITVNMPGTYELVVTDSLNGCQSIDAAVVDQNNGVPTIMASASDILTCDVQTVTVSSELTGGSGDFSYLWTTSGGTIQSDPTAPSIQVISPGIYQLNVIDNLSKCEDSTDVEVLADDDVIASLEATPEDPRCFGDNNGSIAVTNVNGGNPPYTYEWSNGGMQSSINNLGGGTYSVTVTDANGCSFVQQFILDSPIEVTADLGDNIRVNIGDSVTIVLQTSLDITQIDSTAWSGLAPPCSPCLTNSFIGDVSGLVEVTVYDENGCSATDALSVSIDQPKNVYIPNVISPNDDQSNDFLTVYGPTIQEISKFTIFDRWGNLLYEQQPMTAGAPGWDGTFNGEPLNPGVYVYYAKVLHNDGFEEELIGDVTLVR